MKLTFVPMNEAYATQIVSSWTYEGAHSIYDYALESDHMLDREAWGRGIYAVLDVAEDLIGELSIEFWTEDDQSTPYAEFDDIELINQRELWIGFGLKPDRVGRGHGADFVRACVEYAVERTRYRREFVFLGVAAFNTRAIRAYEKAGFNAFRRVMGSINGHERECIHMRKRLSPDI